MNIIRYEDRRSRVFFILSYLHLDFQYDVNLENPYESMSPVHRYSYLHTENQYESMLRT